MIWTEIALRLGAATLLGAAIGLDREMRHKSAGIRTIGLVTLGTALAVMVALNADPAGTSRVIQGALAGLGFLGGGVIVHHGRSIEGLTTAAAIWTAAALGAACGLGLWPMALTGGVLTFFLLIVARWFEDRFAPPRV